MPAGRTAVRGAARTPPRDPVAALAPAPPRAPRGRPADHAPVGTPSQHRGPGRFRAPGASLSLRFPQDRPPQWPNREAATSGRWKIVTDRWWRSVRNHTGERADELHDLDVLAVDFGKDARAPVVGEGSELLGQVDLLHGEARIGALRLSQPRRERGPSTAVRNRSACATRRWHQAGRRRLVRQPSGQGTQSSAPSSWGQDNRMAVGIAWRHQPVRR